MEFDEGSGRSAAWLARPELLGKIGVATNKERLLSRPREGERAGPAVQMEVGYIPIFKLAIGDYLEFGIWLLEF